MSVVATTTKWVSVCLQGQVMWVVVVCDLQSNVHTMQTCVRGWLTCLVAQRSWHSGGHGLKSHERTVTALSVRCVGQQEEQNCTWSKGDQYLGTTRAYHLCTRVNQRCWASIVTPGTCHYGSRDVQGVTSLNPASASKQVLLRSVVSVCYVLSSECWYVRVH